MKINDKEFFTILATIEIPPRTGIRIMDGISLIGCHVLLHNPDEYAIYGFAAGEITLIDVEKLVRASYPPEYQLSIYTGEGSSIQREDVTIDRLTEKLDRSKSIFLFFNPFLAHASLVAFRELIAHLRAPEGCPWDRKQTHQTLRTNLLEETYEVLEAIDRMDIQAMKEELGDLLLQIVLQAQIASENQHFHIFDVIAAIHQKIIFRHPHVFADLEVRSVEGVVKNWEALKFQERSKKGDFGASSILSSVPIELPALSKAQKYQERAARVGFDWLNIEPVMRKFEEELEEFKQAKNDQDREKELGDLLFALVNLIRWHALDAESVLRHANNRFLKRFQFIEDTVRSRGKKMTDLSLEEMDEIWDQAKRLEVKSAQTGQ